MVLMEKAWVILETCFRSVNTYMFVEPKTGDIPFGVWVHPLARPLAPALEAIGERGAMCLAKALEAGPRACVAGRCSQCSRFLFLSNGMVG